MAGYTVVDHKMKHRHLESDKIFAYKNYDDFNSKYFNKKLFAMEEINRAKHVKDARSKYAKMSKGSGGVFD